MTSDILGPSDIAGISSLPQQAVAGGPALAVIILAAGRGSRMGGDKMMRNVAGKPMIARVVDVAEATSIRPIIIVLGVDAPQARRALGPRNVSYAINGDVDRGLSSSLKIGVREVPAHCAGAIILLGDMPAVLPETLDALQAQAALVPHCDAVVLTHDGRRGNPVLLMRSIFASVSDLDGDRGARALLTGPGVVELPVFDPGILFDIDTPEQSAEYEAALFQLEARQSSV